MNATKIVKWILYVLLIVIILGGIKSLGIYRKAFASNTNITGKEGYHLYIRSNYTYDSVLKILKNDNVLKNMRSFNWTAQKKNYPSLIKPGHYIIGRGMSNNAIVNMLRAGRQVPVELTFNNIRTVEQLAGVIEKQIDASADSMIELSHDQQFLDSLGFNKYTIPAMFIPNTYEFYWNTNARQFLKRMKEEYDKFWTDERIKKADKIDLSPEEVITLASIVNEETKMADERPMIAGVYINRLKKGMKLQADPTVIYAQGNFNMKRVWQKHYQIDSPYNTYKYFGLPPGPICIPDISSIDAVLNYSKHKYIFFCAKPDFSGYHNFARTLKEHNRNAELYRKQLNKRRIYR
jgi:UPF0755 protein